VKEHGTFVACEYSSALISGPTITPQESTAHYKVNALGFAATAMLQTGRVSVGLKYFHEFQLQICLSGVHAADFWRDYILNWKSLGDMTRRQAPIALL
jgi:hypothetical protein